MQYLRAPGLLQNTPAPAHIILIHLIQTYKVCEQRDPRAPAPTRRAAGRVRPLPDLNACAPLKKPARPRPRLIYASHTLNTRDPPPRALQGARPTARDGQRQRCSRPAPRRASPKLGRPPRCVRRVCGTYGVRAGRFELSETFWVYDLNFCSLSRNFVPGEAFKAQIRAPRSASA